MIEQIKKVAEQLEENESKKILLESEITYLEEVLKHGVTSRFAEENAIYIYSPKTGHEIRKKLEEYYKLMHPKLSIPKKIAELVNTGDTEYIRWSFADDFIPGNDFVGTGDDWRDHENLEAEIVRRKALVSAYLAGKALGVELVEVTDD